MQARPAPPPRAFVFLVSSSDPQGEALLYIPALARVLLRRRATWLLGGTLTITVPFACSQSNPDPQPGATATPTAATLKASAQLLTIRARFQGALDPQQRAERKTASVELPARAT